ncbi:pyridoxine 4-dehydrogenase [Kitasatospora sp. GP30]|jgi:aryl-alcohol dehydrogenase-like predicted oxidoreductase|uniref:aldo/keto reductase n=1 Tax=Kitasatospora sp. GP30 TaxID=3035084 RepID=UPI000C6FDC22|nr:aldo/keto reductase [Kitasatospora sp. GP30]MDH6142792.1 pyridoxine 4-dehydrogenase [Kitasatospora sp. GP30]
MNTMITIAGKPVPRLGLGTMHLTGAGAWGGPADPADTLALLRTAVHDLGILHVDTADAYGPRTVEELIRAALHPYPQPLLLATKVGMVRPAPNVWRPLGRREYLRAAVEASLRRLGTERIDLCYLHRVDPTVPLVDQVGELAALRQEGKIAEVGLSKVTPEQIQEACKVVPVAAVQNCLNLAEPDDAAVAYCQDHGIPYVPYRPLHAGQLDPAKALRWLLDLGPHVAPIPGTADPEHLLGLDASAS